MTAPRCPAEDIGDRLIGGPVGGGRYKMRLRVLCELDDEHDGQHQSTFPDGTVWQWGDTPPTIRAGGVDDDGLDNVTGTQLCRGCGHTRREHYRGRLSCVHERPGSGGFDCPCGEYVEPVVLEQPAPELVPAEIACAWCDVIYPDSPHEPDCPAYGDLTRLENAITDVIRAHAFVPLHDRYAIARHLIAEGWRPRT
ncbi:DnaQ-like DNA polymerase III subunit [Gordonia phage Tardus]|uniref:DnaQ-like DNA polymerase III subunit n=1 Tax=Gordonia phage Tardus TaxID=2939734 RepID=A0A9E7E4T0_9CAUD|nr:DnaQ-like DNA polymerase III subunit [Gordonia phage Tardus]